MKAMSGERPRDYDVYHDQANGLTTVYLRECVRLNGDHYAYDEYVVILPYTPDIARQLETDLPHWLSSARSAEATGASAYVDAQNNLQLVQGMLTDAQASRVKDVYPVMSYSGLPIEAGARINWEGELYRAAIALWDREDNDPAHAPTLWERIMYRDGVRIIPEVITAGMAFALDELGWWPADGQVYRSKLAGNVWTPVQHAAGWEMIGERS